jgi:CTP:molybdopterin cytidylyltransferase MocA
MLDTYRHLFHCPRMETIFLTVEVIKVTFQKPGQGFAIVKGKPYNDTGCPKWIRAAGVVTVKGDFGCTVQPGDLFDVTTTVTNDPKWGRQLKVVSAQIAARADHRGIFCFLRKLPHVGDSRAEKIIEHFGGPQEVFDMLDSEPERLAEIRGITAERAAEAAAVFADLQGLRSAWELCAELQLDGRTTIRIMERLGAGARDLIAADPYALMAAADLPFVTVDRVAEAAGVKRDDPRRLAAGMQCVLAAALREGHTWVALDQVLGDEVSRDVAKMRDAVQLTEDELATGLTQLQTEIFYPDDPERVLHEIRVVEVNGRYYRCQDWLDEQAICTGLAAMLAA